MCVAEYVCDMTLLYGTHWFRLFPCQHLRERVCICICVSARASAPASASVTVPGRGRVSVDVFVYALVRIHVLDVFLISNDFVVSAMKTIFQFDQVSGRHGFRCAAVRSRPQKVLRQRATISGALTAGACSPSQEKNQEVPKKKRPYGCTLKAPDVAVSAQCVVERVAVVSDMMDIVICVDHSCVFGIS